MRVANCREASVSDVDFAGRRPHRYHKCLACRVGNKIQLLTKRNSEALVARRLISLKIKEKMGMVFCRGCGKEIHETALSCPHCGAPQRGTAQTSTKSQSVAALLAAFLGGLGIHRFYLGKTVSGILYFIFSWTGIPAIIAFFEIFSIAFMSQENWAKKYNNGQLSNPVNGGIKMLALIFPIIFVTGILAAIALPAYHDYSAKARARAVQTY